MTEQPYCNKCKNYDFDCHCFYTCLSCFEHAGNCNCLEQTQYKKVTPKEYDDILTAFEVDPIVKTVREQ